MRINNNLMAMNTHRQLGINTASGAKSIEKLSSGFRINRAGDDAAGLAISEKMRAQIRGLNMASKNSQDGISLIQTAEGALNETHSILQRMRELAVQSANDTNVTVDRGEIQKEMNQLSSEINRIANTTEFNTMKLLNGDRSITYNTGTSSVTTTQLAAGTINVRELSGYNVTDATGKYETALTGGITIAAGEFASAFSDTSGTTANSIDIVKTSSGFTVNLAAPGSAGLTFTAADTLSADANGDFVYDNHGVSFTISAASAAGMSTGATLTLDSLSATGTFALGDDVGTNTTVAATFASVTVATSPDNAAVRNVVVTQSGGSLVVDLTDSAGTSIQKDTFTSLTTSGTINYNDHGITFTFTAGTVTAGSTFSAVISLDALVSSATTLTDWSELAADNSLKFQVGANQSQQMSLDIADMQANALNITASSGGSATVTIGSTSVTAYFVSAANVTDGTSATNTEFALDVSSATKAGAAITVINAAIETVSGERSKLGAVQNRLEHTISNLDTSAENLQSAESRIRDVDMAKEMMNLTKNNILTQAAQAMLAQANQAPQGVLQLLR